MSTANSNGLHALRPRARIMRTIGEELISSETVAILELVKNAYDADAGYVLVRFEATASDEDGVLFVEDDGHGMSLGVVENSWMEPATITKKQTQESRYLNRRLLGEKGVGRFATARLATELELCTRAVGSEKEVYAIFDWSQFDNDDLYLDQVLILAEERQPSVMVADRELPVASDANINGLPRDGSHGTQLKMNHLKRSWGTRELSDLRRGLSRLVSPFEADRGFRIFLQLPDQTVGTAQELEPPEIIKYPHYELSGSVDQAGKFDFDIKLNSTAFSQKIVGWFRRSTGAKQEIVESAEEEPGLGEVPIVCGAFSFNILVWDRDQLGSVDQKIGTGIRSIRRDLDSIAGVSIYRDGFRVLPYGEPENDWLKLDLRRVQNPTFRLSNNQITGFVRIGADSNPQLKDQSNREGLDNNQAYSDLQDVVRVALSKLEVLRYNEKQRSSSDAKPNPSGGSLLAQPDTTVLRQKIVSSNADSETLELFDDTTQAWAKQIVRIREVLSRYQSLATLGQLVDKVIHDGRQPLATIQGQSSLARESIARKKKSETDAECLEVLNSVDEKLSRVKSAAGLIDLLLKRIEPLGGRKKGRPSKVYINEIIKNSFAHFSTEIATLGIEVSLPKKDDLVQVDAMELQEVLINLIANSIYWLEKVPKEKRSIVVECSRPTAGELDVIFADSGPGIPAANRSSIFEPYFTTKPEGVGLGLVIAGEVVRDYYDGSLELLNAGPLPGAVFRIRLRKRV